MADDKRIVIELRATGSNFGAVNRSNNPFSVLGDDSGKETNLVDILRNLQNPVGKVASKIFDEISMGRGKALMYVASSAFSVIKNSVLYQIHKYYNLTENYKAEQDLNNTVSIISNVAGGFSSVLSGAITGAQVGQVPGAIVGAVVGAATWGANTWVNAQKAWDQERISLSTMRIQSGYQQARLGLIDDGRGTQN